MNCLLTGSIKEARHPRREPSLTRVMGLRSTPSPSGAPDENEENSVGVCFRLKDIAGPFSRATMTERGHTGMKVRLAESPNPLEPSSTSIGIEQGFCQICGIPEWRGQVCTNVYVDVITVRAVLNKNSVSCVVHVNGITVSKRGSQITLSHGRLTLICKPGDWMLKCTSSVAPDRVDRVSVTDLSLDVGSAERRVEVPSAWPRGLDEVCGWLADGYHYRKIFGGKPNPIAVSGRDRGVVPSS